MRKSWEHWGDRQADIADALRWNRMLPELEDAAIHTQTWTSCRRVALTFSLVTLESRHTRLLTIVRISFGLG